MMFFGLAAILAVIRFRKVSGTPFTKAWFAWLSLSALLISAVFRSVSMNKTVYE